MRGRTFFRAGARTSSRRSSWAPRWRRPLAVAAHDLATNLRAATRPTSLKRGFCSIMGVGRPISGSGNRPPSFRRHLALGRNPRSGGPRMIREGRAGIEAWTGPGSVSIPRGALSRRRGGHMTDGGKMSAMRSAQPRPRSKPAAAQHNRLVLPFVELAADVYSRFAADGFVTEVGPGWP